MKILTEEQQLFKLKDELFQTSQFLQSEINSKENKVRDFEDSSWASKRNKARVLKYDLKEYKKIHQFINDYYSMVSSRHNEIVESKKVKP